MTTQPARLPWSLEDVREILAGTMDPDRIQERIKTPDRKGLSPVAFAALRAAATADALTPLLELLEPPGEEEKAKLDLVLDLLERIAESQIELGRRMDALESAISGRGAASRTGSLTASARRASAS